LAGRPWQLQSALVGIAVSVLFLVLLFLNIDLGQMRQSLAAANYALTLSAMGLFALSVGFQALRWRLLLRRVANVSALSLYRIVFVGHMANGLLPLRSGELVRAFLLGRSAGVSGMATLGTVAVERVLDVLVLFLLLLVSLAMNEVRGGWLWGLALTSGPALAAILFLLITAVLWQSQTMRLFGLLSRLAPSPWRPVLLGWAEAFLAGIRATGSPLGLAGALLCSLAFWLAVAGIYQLVGLGFALEEGFGAYLLATAVSNLGLSLPASQGGLGPYEFLIRESLVAAGAPPATATAYAIGLRVVFFVPAVALGTLFLWWANVPLREVLAALRRRRETEAPVR